MDQIGAEEALALVAAQLMGDPGWQPGHRGVELRLRPLVGDGDPRAAPRAELGRRDPGASETDDEHAPLGELEQARLPDLERRDES